MVAVTGKALRYLLPDAGVFLHAGVIVGGESGDPAVVPVEIHHGVHPVVQHILRHGLHTIQQFRRNGVVVSHQIRPRHRDAHRVEPGGSIACDHFLSHRRAAPGGLIAVHAAAAVDPVTARLQGVPQVDAQPHFRHDVACGHIVPHFRAEVRLFLCLAALFSGGAFAAFRAAAARRSRHCRRQYQGSQFLSKSHMFSFILSSAVSWSVQCACVSSPHPAPRPLPLRRP